MLTKLASSATVAFPPEMMVRKDRHPIDRDVATIAPLIPGVGPVVAGIHGGAIAAGNDGFGAGVEQALRSGGRSFLEGVGGGLAGGVGGVAMGGLAGGSLATLSALIAKMRGIEGLDMPTIIGTGAATGAGIGGVIGGAAGSIAGKAHGARRAAENYNERHKLASLYFDTLNSTRSALQTKKTARQAFMKGAFMSPPIVPAGEGSTGLRVHPADSSGMPVWDVIAAGLAGSPRSKAVNPAEKIYNSVYDRTGIPQPGVIDQIKHLSDTGASSLWNAWDSSVNPWSDGASSSPGFGLLPYSTPEQIEVAKRTAAQNAVDGRRAAGRKALEKNDMNALAAEVGVPALDQVRTPPAKGFAFQGTGSSKSTPAATTAGISLPEIPAVRPGSQEDVASKALASQGAESANKDSGDVAEVAPAAAAPTASGTASTSAFDEVMGKIKGLVSAGGQYAVDHPLRTLAGGAGLVAGGLGLKALWDARQRRKEEEELAMRGKYAAFMKGAGIPITDNDRANLNMGPTALDVQNRSIVTDNDRANLNAGPTAQQMAAKPVIAAPALDIAKEKSAIATPTPAPAPLSSFLRR